MGIANKLNVSVSELARANPTITNLNHIRTGQRLVNPNCLPPKVESDWKLLWKEVSNTPLWAYRLSRPTFAYHENLIFVKAGNLEKIADLYQTSPFVILERNDLSSISQSYSGPLIVPYFGNPILAKPDPLLTWGDWVADDFGKQPSTVPSLWPLVECFTWIMQGGIASSSNPEIERVKYYPNVPKTDPRVEPRHVTQDGDPRAPKRIACWRTALKEWNTPGGKPPDWWGIRYNANGSVSYAWYWSDLPIYLTTGGKWIKDIMIIITVDNLRLGANNFYNWSTAMSDLSKGVFAEFESLPFCPDLNIILDEAIRAMEELN